MRRIAVLLMTCGRPEYTARTVGSFLEHNNALLDRFLLLHADDASGDDGTREIAAGAGFETVVATPHRMGIRVMRTALIREAEARGVHWAMVLENDIVTLRPFPWELFRYATRFRQVYTLRLYGAFKDAEKTVPCLDTHKREGHAPVEWRPFAGAPEKSQIGRIHWSAQPSVTRVKELVDLHRTGYEPPRLTVRVKKNVVSHIGVEKTPGGRP